MNNLKVLLASLKGKNFEDLKKNCEFTIKEDGNLYMLSFNDNNDLNDDLVRTVNGIILEKDTNKLVHYSFQKAYDGLEAGKGTDPYLGELGNFRSEIMIEGTLIKIFYYQNEWCIGTSRNINAVYSYWGGDKSFKELFIETSKESDVQFDFDLLDKNCCYSYILQHPEVTIGYDISVSNIVPLSKINLETLEEEYFTLEYSKNSLAELKLNLSFGTNFIIVTEEGKRIKLLSDEYRYAQSLLNNNPSMKWTCLEIIQNGFTYDFIKYFPSKCDTLDYVDEKINTVINEIHRLYFNRFVKREVTEIPYRYRKTIYQLHGRFKSTGVKTTKDTVAHHLINLDTKTLYWVLELSSN
jgi:hypothetical protein